MRDSKKIDDGFDDILVRFLHLKLYVKLELLIYMSFNKLL